MNVKKVVSVISFTIDNVQRIILLLSSFLLVTVMSTTVVMRYIMNKDIFGLEELVIVPGFWLYFLGAAYASRERNFHIAVDLVDSYVTNETILKVIDFITRIITLMVSMIMTYWGFQFLQRSYISGSTTTALDIPLYISHGTIFIGFLLMTAYFLIHFITDVSSLIKGSKPTKDGDVNI